MRSRASGSIGGRPGCLVLLYVHFFRTSSRCHRSSVSGRTMNEDQLVFVIARLAAASRTRSRRLSRGRFTCRWSTFTWCRSTRSSMSFSSARRPPTPRRRWIRKYRSENSMELLPAEEKACYRCSRLRIAEVEPFKQGTLARTQRAGLTPSQEQVDRTRLCQAAVRGNDAIMAHLRATNDVKVYLPTVARTISAALGADYASLITP